MNKKFLNLVNEEMSLLDLSIELENLGCEDIGYFGNMEEILVDKCMVVATDLVNYEEHIIITFEVSYSFSDDEGILSTIIKILNIEKY